jgi:hypothetical protein
MSTGMRHCTQLDSFLSFFLQMNNLFKNKYILHFALRNYLEMESGVINAIAASVKLCRRSWREQ